MGKIKGLNRNVQKTHEWVHAVQDELRWTDERRAYTALRAVLHALRDRLTLEEIVQFAAQLPTFVRGLYYEGWDPTHTPLRRRDADSFLAQIGAAFKKTRQTPADSRTIARAVLRVIQDRISPGEIEDIKSLLPARIRQFWPEDELEIPRPRSASARKAS
ncbi:MAG TPA: DUF2267 domain-containing protein [Terriglobia bacterium]|nr:DUF2267 domain-containing protein [Terriglobia bacterium]